MALTDSWEQTTVITYFWNKIKLEVWYIERVTFDYLRLFVTATCTKFYCLINLWFVFGKHTSPNDTYAYIRNTTSTALTLKEY